MNPLTLWRDRKRPRKKVCISRCSTLLNARLVVINTQGFTRAHARRECSEAVLAPADLGLEPTTPGGGDARSRCCFQVRPRFGSRTFSWCLITRFLRRSISFSLLPFRSVRLDDVRLSRDRAGFEAPPPGHTASLQDGAGDRGRGLPGTSFGPAFFFVL